MLRSVLSCLLLLVLPLSGCQLAFGGLDVQAVDSSVQKPSNVAVYVAVTDRDEPVTDLDESNFRVFENEQLLEKSQAKLTLLERSKVAVHHVLFLVDLSGDLNTASQAELARGIAAFARSLTRDQDVSIFGFDGSTELRRLAEYQRGAVNIEPLTQLKGGDPSRNLNGAVVEGLERLDAELMRTKLPVRVGTLVVFTRGPDIAGRTSAEQLQATLDESHRDIFAVGLESEENAYLDDIGRSGTFLASTLGEVGVTLDHAAVRLGKAYARYYLLQYCSPSRAGTPTARLEISHTTAEGEVHTGDLEVAFNASGFGPGCDPQALPKFQVAAKDPWEMDASSSSSEQDPPQNGHSSRGTTGTRQALKPPAAGPPSPEQPPARDDDEDDIVPPPKEPGYE